MEKTKNPQKKLGEAGYLNKNCWLVRSLGYAPYRRCQYCELKFRNCLFLHYQVTSAILLTLILISSFLIERKNSEFLIIVVFTLIIVYGYFFNKSTDRIIETNFAQRKAEESALREQISREEAEKLAIRERALRQKTEKLAGQFKRLDEIKTQFMLATQHHLRTPLTAIQGYLSMLVEGSWGEINPLAKTKIKGALNSTRKLIKLVNDFLDVTKYEVGKKALTKREVQLENIFQEVINELRPAAEEKKLYLKFEKAQFLSKIMADPEKLKEAIYNIILNGINYTLKGGVTIKLEEKEGKSILAKIQDSGIGMKKEEIKGLFKKTFERGREAKKVYTTGRGIGLFLSAKIIQAHQGKIWAESPGQGKGSTFYIELPIE